MNANEFVQNFKKEKDYCLELYTSGEPATAVSELIKQMGLSDHQQEKMNAVIDGILNDVFYSILLGLDGCGTIGDIQHTYKIHDENGSIISECGDLEAEAWEPFNE
ncbi:conserved hypothetical protein [Shewanella halifaxensis HAW-EB4]|uniref:Uncharacterized protein n=1 Tax=Shewanella halifaxensis (strain HAW-EB4) TaxID=458817 RepID=B0TRG7_SHEHH|nr:hypothetical protein [Shewanella halifaxensis]ABZ75139.1 conserved hypothetical protein [Shewanella halifaxensis HAW-EB4]